MDKSYNAPCRTSVPELNEHHSYCLNTGKSNVSMEYVMFYLLKSVQNINDVDENNLFCFVW